MGVRAMVSPFALVIVDNLNTRRAWFILRPLKAGAPLVINPNGILTRAGSLQGFQPVGVERSKIAQRDRRVEYAQALLGLVPERLPPANLFAGCETLRVPVAITPYHPMIYISLDE